MLLDLDSEMRALQSHEIRTHKDALAHFTVRYSSFTTPNYPLDAPLPAFALAEHGFHFDSYTRAIKCVTCDYTNTDLFDDLLLSVLNKHLRASPQCEQARRSLSLILSESSVAAEPPLEIKLGGVAIGSSVPTKRPAASNTRSSIAAVAAAAINKQFATEEARIRSFDNEKLIIGIAKLAANGLYRVPKQDLLLLSASKDKAVAKKPFSSGGSMNKSKLSLLRGDQMKANDQEEGDEEMSSVMGEVTQTSQIEAIAKSLPTLYHVRCAYCPYECLLFKTSLLNTLYKSPFDEHREKYASQCPIFALNSDLAGSKSTSSGVDLHRDLAFNSAKEKKNQPDLAWLQTLYEFESPHHHQSTPNQMRRTSSMRNLGGNLQSLNESSTSGNKHPMLAKNLLSHSDDGQDVELREMPKIMDKLYEIYNQASRPMRPMTTSASSGAALCNPLVYVPGSAGGKNAIKSMTTSDFSQLQSVLNKSDNVLSRKAHHPDYAQYQARLDSFKEWPASMSQQPSDLAKAGFYYFGIKDMVKCFFCNGGLKNWDHNDDPFQDHVRWFPTCQYIRQLMGHEYIESVREKFKNMESGFNDENSGDRPSDRGNSGGGGGDRLNASTSSLQSTLTNRPSGSTSSSFSSWSSSSSSHHQQSPPPHPQQQQQQRSVSPRTLNSRMDSYMVRRILDHSLISRESIRNAYEMQLSSPPSTSVDQHSSRHPTASLYNDDFHSPIEMALASYSIDRNKRFKAESFERLSDFVIFNLSPKVTVSAIVGFVYVKYGLYPMSVRILREHGQNENRCFVLVSLQSKDRRHLNDIIKDLGKTSNELESLKTKQPIVVARTVWSEIEERAKSLLDKPIVKPLASTPSIEQQPPVTPTRSLSLESGSAKTNDEAMDVTPSSSVAKEDEPAKKMATSDDDASTPVDDALQLKEENERLKNERLCVVCLGREKNVLFLPCAHLTACLECSLSLQNCPMCRSKIQATVRTFT